MRKFLLTIGLMVAAAIPSMAQKGTTAIGFDLGVAPSVESGLNYTNFEIDGKVQGYVTNDIRLEGKIGYGFRDKNIGMLTIAANAHYMVTVAPKFEMYPIVGVGYARPAGKHWSENRFLFDVGVGGQINLTSLLSAQIEVKYEYIKDFQRMPITVGLAYRF